MRPFGVPEKSTGVSGERAGCLRIAIAGRCALGTVGSDLDITRKSEDAIVYCESSK